MDVVVSGFTQGSTNCLEGWRLDTRLIILIFPIPIPFKYLSQVLPLGNMLTFKMQINHFFADDVVRLSLSPILYLSTAKI